MKFAIEQIALCPPFGMHEKARELLAAIGLTDWTLDEVSASGEVFGQKEETSVADLAFNYQNSTSEKPLELEILRYKHGINWMSGYHASASHLGMHCSAEELAAWTQKFSSMGIGIAQQVNTFSHTNPFLVENGRKYTYTIFDTRRILGIDLKFIVRRDRVPSP